MQPTQLEKLIKELHTDAYLWARQCCNFHDWLAKDVLQQVYLKILEGKAKYNEKSSVKTWLFAVIRYTAIENLKKESKLYPIEEGIKIEAEAETESDFNHEKLMQQLPEKQREVLLLMFYHELTLEKSAEVMGIHVGTVRTHYDRAKKNLKTLIQKKRAHAKAR